MIIKICGITREEDAELLADLGVDWIGLNFYSGSPRVLTLERARAVRAAAKDIPAVGVFVNDDRKRIETAIERVGLDFVQLHGNETPEDSEGYGVPVIRAVRPVKEEDLEALDRYRVDYFLIDGAGPGYGGKGVVANWDLAAHAAERARVLLAGGLTSANVAEGIRRVSPWGVDVASGVESSPGLKDKRKLGLFIAAVRGAIDDGA